MVKYDLEMVLYYALTIYYEFRSVFRCRYLLRAEQQRLLSIEKDLSRLPLQ